MCILRRIFHINIYLYFVFIVIYTIIMIFHPQNRWYVCVYFCKFVNPCIACTNDERFAGQMPRYVYNTLYLILWLLYDIMIILMDDRCNILYNHDLYLRWSISSELCLYLSILLCNWNKNCMSKSTERKKIKSGEKQ